jgi:hypothetical protein
MPLHLGTGSNVVARKRKQLRTGRGWRHLQLEAASDIVQIGVRLEERLRRRLERAASQSGQSMNAEIVERLKRSFQSDEDKISLIARAIVDTYPDIANRIEELFAEARLWRQVKDMPAGPPVQNWEGDEK